MAYMEPILWWTDLPVVRYSKFDINLNHKTFPLALSLH